MYAEKRAFVINSRIEFLLFGIDTGINQHITEKIRIDNLKKRAAS